MLPSTKQKAFPKNVSVSRKTPNPKTNRLPQQKGSKDIFSKSVFHFFSVNFWIQVWILNFSHFIMALDVRFIWARRLWEGQQNLLATSWNIFSFPFLNQIIPSDPFIFFPFTLHRWWNLNANMKFSFSLIIPNKQNLISFQYMRHCHSSEYSFSFSTNTHDGAVGSNNIYKPFA